MSYRMILPSMMAAAFMSFGALPASVATRAAQPAARDAHAASVLFVPSPQSPAGKQYVSVTIKQLRADPKGYAQRKVAVTGPIGEISTTDQAFELVQTGEQLHVLVGGLSPEEQAKIYAAKLGARVTAYGEFSGYVLWAERVKFVK